MQIAGTFDPSVGTSGTFTVAQSAGNGRLVLYNESNISLLLKFQNGSSAYLPAWVANIYAGNFGGQKLLWSQSQVLTSDAPPLSFVLAEVYGEKECVHNTFPCQLPRQAKVGNVITTNVVAATSIVNDNNPGLTSILEATVAGDPAACVRLTNDGQLSIGTNFNPGSVAFDNNKIASDGFGDFTVVGNLISGAFFSAGVATSDQTIANGATLTISATFNGVTMATNVTGILMPPGSFDGQVCGLINHSANTMTFAVNTASLVSDGLLVSLKPFSLIFLVWTFANQQWYATKY